MNYINLSFGLILAVSLLNQLAHSNENDPLIDPFVGDLDVVISATRLKQSIRNIPGSITIVDQRTIRDLGLRTVPEILRLVPGMVVNQVTGNDYRINYHGTNGLVPRRMQVLLDGMSVYQGGYAFVNWHTLGVDVEDIDRVEVNRSPNSATYGANAFQAVISIYTKKPNKVKGWTSKALTGSQGVSDGFLRYGGNIGQTNYSVSYSHQESSGYEKNINHDTARDFSKIDQVNFHSETEFRDRSNLELNLGYLRSENGREFVEPNETSKPDYDIDHHFINAIWKKETSNKNEIQFKLSQWNARQKQDWSSCYPAITLSPELRAMQLANPSYASTLLSGGFPTGGSPEDDLLALAVLNKVATLGGAAAAFSPLCVENVNQDAIDITNNFEFQNTHIFSDLFRVVSGLGVTYNSFESETYANGKISGSKLYGFANAEYQLESLVFNAGLMIEKNENGSGKTERSPKFSINYHLNDNHTFKFVVSKAIRTPDFLETDRDWSYFVRGFEDGSEDRYFYLNAVSNETLDSEKIISRELIYYGQLPSIGLGIDIKLFNEDLYDLISEKLQFNDWVPTNNGGVELNGFETEVHYEATEKLNLGLTYAYVDSDTNNFYEESLYTRHSGSLSAIYKLNDFYTFGFAYFGSENSSNYSFDRFDLSLNKRFSINKVRSANLMVKLSYQPSSFGLYDTQASKNLSYNDSDTFLNVGFKVEF